MCPGELVHTQHRNPPEMRLTQCAEYEGGESELTCACSLRTWSSSSPRDDPNSDCEAGVGAGESLGKTIGCFASSEGEAAGVT